MLMLVEMSSSFFLLLPSDFLAIASTPFSAVSSFLAMSCAFTTTPSHLLRPRPSSSWQSLMLGISTVRTFWISIALISAAASFALLASLYVADTLARFLFSCLTVVSSSS